jgi:hypothetical protein
MNGLQSVLDSSNTSHMPKSRLVWKKEPEEDFEGALAFLSLGMSKAKAAKLISKLRRTKPIEYAAKDLLRVSGLPLLPREEGVSRCLSDNLGHQRHRDEPSKRNQLSRFISIVWQRV